MSRFHTQVQSIHAAAFIQSDDPSATVPSQMAVKVQWIDTSTSPYTWKKRNDANDGWDVMGYMFTSAVAGNGLSATSGVLAVNVDGSTLEINSDTLRVKDGGLPAAKLASDSVTQAKLADNSVGTNELIDANVTDAKLATLYIKADGTRAFSGAQSMGGFKLTNVGTPATSTDAATKGYVDSGAFIKPDGTVPFTANESMGGFRLTSVGSPVATTDAANKSYVDTLALGVTQKENVRVASTANVTVSSAPAAIDGVTLSTNDRILLKDQTVGSQNGLYVFNGAASALTRSTDASTSSEVKAGIFVIAIEGTVNHDTSWILTTDNPITLGTTALTFAPFANGANANGSSASAVTTVRLASTATLTLASTVTTIDGVSLSSADRVLLKNQSSGAENGVYSWNSGTSLLSRASDYSSTGNYQSGLLVIVSEGAVSADSIWMLTTNGTPGTIVVGTTALAFSRTPILPNGFVTDAQLVTSYLKADGSRALTGNQSAGGFGITNLASPNASTDVVNKGYVDALSLGVTQKEAVRVASTGNVTISSAPSAIDGVTLSSTNRVLLKDQAAGAENGIYVFNGAASALTRSTDANSSAEVAAGMFVIATEGTVNANTGWVLTTYGTITLGSTVLTFAPLATGTSAGAPSVSSLITSARCASTATLNLASTVTTIDGVTLTATTRILLKNQSTAAQNGLYVWSSTTQLLSRAADFIASGKYQPGLLVVVSEGTANADSMWTLTTDGTIIVGTTSLTFTRSPIIPSAYITDAQLATLYIKADGTRAFSGDHSAGGFLITNVASPSASTDAANKTYVDSVVAASASAAPLTGSRLAADFTKTSNTTYGDIWSFTLASSTVYHIELFMHITAATASGGFKFQLSGTAVVSSVCLWLGSANLNSFFNSTTLTSNTVSTSSPTSPDNARMYGTIACTTGGTFALQGAQNTSNATPLVVFTGSSMRVVPLAA